MESLMQHTDFSISAYLPHSYLSLCVYSISASVSSLTTQSLTTQSSFLYVRVKTSAKSPSLYIRVQVSQNNDVRIVYIRLHGQYTSPTPIATNVARTESTCKHAPATSHAARLAQSAAHIRTV